MRISHPSALLLAALAATLTVVGTRASAESPARGDARAEARVPVVVELFTSEGCSSCPPADDLFADLLKSQPVAGVTIVPLAFHVDYWDRLGWADPFASADATARQHDYAAAFGNRNVYTPQMVVDGSAEFVGSDRAKALAAIRAAASRPKVAVTLDYAVEGDAVKVRSVTLGRADGVEGKLDVILAVTEDGLSSDVRRVENRGKTLDHTNVVRSRVSYTVAEVDHKTSAVVTVPLRAGWDRRRLTLVALAQEPGTGRVVGASSTPLAPE